MDLLLELRSGQTSFCLNDVMLNLIDSIKDDIEETEYDSKHEQNLMSHIKTLRLCVQFCHEQKNSFDDKVLLKFFHEMELFYYTAYNFMNEVEMTNLLCNLLIQCFQLLCTSQSCSLQYSDIIHERLRNLLVNRRVREHHHFDIPEDFGTEKRIELQVKRAKLLIQSCSLFPSHLKMELIRNLTDHVCGFNTYSAQFLDCLSLLDMVFINGNIIYANDMAQIAYQSVDHLMKCVRGSLQNSYWFQYWISSFPNNARVSTEDDIFNDVAFCICILDVVFKYLSTIESLSGPSFTNILQRSEMWVVIQIGAYHKLKAIRKKANNALRNLLLFVEKYKPSFTVHWIKHCRDELENCSSKVAAVDLSSCNNTPVADNCLISFNSRNHSASLSLVSKYIQICDILEEDQTHVVAPATIKVKSFLLNISNESEMRSYSSWICPIFLRMFFHDNKAIQKDGLILCLTSSFGSCLMQQQSWQPFISHGLMRLINCDYVYYGDYMDASEEDVKISVQLCQFLAACHQSCQSPVILLKALLRAICNQTWSSISLFNICEALLQLPCTAAWECDDYHLLRKLCVEIVETHNIPVRIATQRKLVGCLMRHCYLSNFRLVDFMALLLEFVKSKALVYNSSIWNEVSTWLAKSILMMKHDFGTITNVAQLMTTWLDKYLNNDFSPLIIECAVIAFCFLSNGLRSNALDTELAQELTYSVMNLIASIMDKAVTYLYMPVNKIEHVFYYVEKLYHLKNMESAQGSSEEADKFVVLSVKTCEGVIKCLHSNPSFLLGDIVATRVRLSAAEEIVEFVFTKLTAQQKIRMHELLRSTIDSIIKCLISSSKKQQPQSENFLVSKAMVFHWSLKQICRHAIKLDPQTHTICSDMISDMHFIWSDIPAETFTQKENLSTLLVCNWMCVPFAFVFNSPDRVLLSLEKVLELFCDQLDVVPVSCLVKLFAVSKCIFEQVKRKDHLNLCGLCVSKMTKLTFELGHSSVFRPLYHNFVNAIFQPALLSADNHSNLNKQLGETLMQVILCSQSKSGLLEEVLRCCKRYWLSHSSETHQCENMSISILKNIFALQTQFVDKIMSSHLKSALSNLNFFLHCLLFSPLATKASKCIIKIFKRSSTFCDDVTSVSGHTVSLEATSLLLHLNISNPEHMLLANHVIDELIKMNNVMFERKPRYHFASATHYEKQKIWQNILILIPLLYEKKSKDVANTFIVCLAEDMQTSVRHFVEWCLVLLLYKFPAYEHMVLEKIRKNVSTGSSYSAICSYLTVALLCGLTRLHKEESIKQKACGLLEPQAKCHQGLATTAMLLRSSENQYFMNLINTVVPWCMSQQFTIRLYAHAVLLRITQHFRKSGEEDIINKSYPWLQSSLDFADHSSGNVKKNWLKIRQHFMLFHFDPISEFSAESIFITLPRLCHVDVPLLEELEGVISSKWLPLFSLDDTLRNIQESTWETYGSKPKSFAAEQKFGNGVDADEWNMQRKIVVSKESKGSRKPGLILVASLVTKMSNLGGLTRTCEVFGAEKLVVANLNCLDDPSYQSLSVTAHKWLPMQEIKSHQLKEYLCDLKKNGYVIIGAEQTEKSQCLSQYKFPVKTAIVLGNEKEGIPHSFLSLFDVCIEIPQLGVIRSLNVHVSGAIVLWEYCKQHSVS